MEIKERVIEVKDYLSKSNLPASDFVINPYVGCPHACRYCYACFMKRFTGHSEQWGSFVDIKHCNKPISRASLSGKSVFLSSVTDCYNKFEEKYGITRSILSQLVEVDCSVSISTKSSLIVRDIDLLKKLGNRLTVSFSVNTTDESFRRDMDHASSIADRLAAMRTLHENGIYTVLFMSPIFPGITDFCAIIQSSRSFTDEYWFENLNLRGSYKQDILSYIAQKYPSLSPLYIDIYLKSDTSYWDSLSQEIESCCREHGIRFKNYFHHKKLVDQKKSLTYTR